MYYEWKKDKLIELCSLNLYEIELVETLKRYSMVDELDMEEGLKRNEEKKRGLDLEERVLNQNLLREEWERWKVRGKIKGIVGLESLENDVMII